MLGPISGPMNGPINYLISCLIGGDPHKVEYGEIGLLKLGTKHCRQEEDSESSLISDSTKQPNQRAVA